MEQPGGLSIDERLGHAKKIMSIKFDEEYDYSEPCRCSSKICIIFYILDLIDSIH